MGLRQVLVLADEHYGRNPKFLAFVLLEALANNLRFSDVGAGYVGEWVTAGENVNARLVEFLSCKELVKFGAWCSDSLARPVGDLGSAQALRVAAWSEEFDRRGSHRCGS